MIKVFLQITILASFLLSNSNKLSKAYENYLYGEYYLINKNFIDAEYYFLKSFNHSNTSYTVLKSLIDLYLVNSQYNDVLHYLKIITKEYPGIIDDGMILYEYYMHNKNITDAENILDTLLYYNPNNVDILFEKTDIQYIKQDWDNLINTYYSIYLQNPENLEIINKIYEIGLITNNTILVSKILKEISIYQQSPIIIKKLIEIFINANMLEEAIDYTKLLIENDIQNIDYYILLGELFLQNKQEIEAISTLEPLFNDGEYSADLLHLLLIAYSITNNYEDQIKLCSIFIDKYPDDYFGYEALSFAYYNIKDYDSGLKIANIGYKKFPKKVNLLIIIADIYKIQKKYLYAEKYYLKALKIESKMYNALNMLAILYEEMNYYSKSDSIFNIIISNNTNDAIHLNDYAYIISERENSSINDLKYALNLAEKAISIEPKNPEFLDTIGWIYFKMGTYIKAQEFIEMSLNINKDNPLILEHMGDVYYKLNDSDNALKLYEEALAQDGENLKLIKKLKKINDISK